MAPARSLGFLGAKGAPWRDTIWRELDGVGGFHGDAAEAAVVAGVALHPDVAALAPGCAPRVLDDPVLRAVVGLAVADHRDAVVEVGAAVAGEDAVGVELEGLVAGVDGDGDGLVGDGLGERGLAVGRHVLVPVDHHQRRAPRADGVARSVGGAVRVGGLGGDAAAVLDVLERVLHEPALAPAVVRRVAVDQLLLRQRHQPPRPDRVDALHGHHRGERPAAAALALVLDAGDRALAAPVDGAGEVADALVHEPRERRRGEAVAAEVVGVGPGERGAELLSAHVAEAVEPEAVAPAAALVVLVDVPHVVLERAEPAVLLAVVARHVVVLLPPLVQIPQRLVGLQIPLVERYRGAQLHRRHGHQSSHHRKNPPAANNPPHDRSIATN